ncbi:hypothetical protein [Klenkia sp. PcliD-1-E]|uniref:hypothetical protein n=1 Tax=Klenkia sp. PcliD-1-E TaxID=2954492 RepID=UPI002096DD62|nr:hypothetical protein [Klenkia sp. PcliD-1-E]MCO7220137.1 hypothetical protein [Klenkia sp. PcliD-1-E]
MTSISPTRSGLPARSQRRARTRALSAVLATSGLALLVAPERVVRLLTPDVPEPRAWVVRVLGARSLVQHAVMLVRPTRDIAYAGVAVDAVHAASMVVFAAAWSTYRRPALVSAALATASALLEVAVAPQSDDPVHVPGDVD